MCKTKFAVVKLFLLNLGGFLGLEMIFRGGYLSKKYDSTLELVFEWP